MGVFDQFSKDVLSDVDKAKAILAHRPSMPASPFKFVVSVFIFIVLCFIALLVLGPYTDTDKPGTAAIVLTCTVVFVSVAWMTKGLIYESLTYLLVSSFHKQQSIRWFKEEAKYKVAEGQQPMPSSAEGEIFIRAVLDIEHRIVPKGKIFKRNVKYSVISASFEFSPRAVYQMKMRDFANMVFIYSDPVTDFVKSVAESDIPNLTKDGKIATHLVDILNAPRQLFYFERYDEATHAMDEIKANLKKLKEFCMHGQGDFTNRNAFEA